MRRIIAALIGTAVAVVAGVPAIAAGAPAAVSDWTGWYLGVNAGGDWAGSDRTTFVSAPGTFFGGCTVCLANFAALGNQHLNTSGFTGGVQGGYNWQSNSFLFGIEVDFESFRSAGTTTAVGTFNPNNSSQATITTTASTNWLLTARPRLGFVAGNWLFYGTGGLAITELKAGWSSLITIGPDTESASASATKVGWALGGGIESALPENWMIGAEYIYTSFGRVSANSANLTGSGTLWTDVITHTADLNASILRVRLSKRF